MNVRGYDTSGYSAGSYSRQFTAGFVTHYIISLEATAQTGGTSGMAASAKVNVSVEGIGGRVLINQWTMAELASYCDQKGGGVIYTDSTSTTSAFKLRLAIPAGAFGLAAGDRGRSLTIEVVWPVPSTSFANFVATLGIGNDGQEIETGMLEYSRKSVNLASANYTEVVALNDPDLVEAYVYDTGSVWTKMQVVGEDDKEYGNGPKALWEAMTYQTQEVSSVPAASTIWNSAILAYSEDIVSADGESITITLQNASATGVVTILYVQNRVLEETVSKSTSEVLVKHMRKVEKIEQRDPAKAKALRHIGLMKPSREIRQVANTVNNAMRRRVA